MTIPFESEKLLKIRSVKLENAKGEIIEVNYHELKLKINSQGLCFIYHEENFMPLCRGEKLKNLFSILQKRKKHEQA